MKAVRYLIVVVVLVVSCSDPVCGCPPGRIASAIVRGTASLDTGGPASGAAITIALSELTTPCVQGTMGFLGTADSQGRFRLFVYDAFVGGDSACVFLGARHPGDAPSTRDTIVGPFRMRVGGSPLDSVTVVMVLAL